MNAFASSVMEIIRLVTINPSSVPLLYIIVLIGMIAAWFGLYKTAAALKFPMATSGRVWTVVILLALTALLSAAACRAFISPKIAQPVLSSYLPLLAAVISVLAVSTPLSCFIFKSHYFQTLSSMAVPLVAAAIVAFLANGLSGAFKQGNKGFSTTKLRTDKLNEVIGK